MSKLRLIGLALALALLPCSGYSGDGKEGDGKKADKPAKEEKEKDKDKEKEKEKGQKTERGGNFFTRFWVHTVGGNMGGGLKTGARKISNAFD